jgi:hypothetical protein
MATGFDCATCGERHEGIPLCFGPQAPAPWFEIPPDERERRAELNSDMCVIDETHYFVLGRIELPIVGTSEHFCWLVWVSLSVDNFKRAYDLWETPGRESEPPYFGWLCTALPGYPDPTLHLKTNVHTRAVGVRPLIELEPTSHPLAVEQREGISMKRVERLVEIALHGES